MLGCLGFLILKNYVYISSMHTHATTQIPTFSHCLWVIVWTSDILSLITRSQHNTAQQTSCETNFSFFPPLFSSSAPSLSFSFILFGIEEEGCAVNKGGERKRD